MLARHQGPASDPPHLVLRAEGGPGRGAGHLARCLALGQAWVARKGRCTLVAGEVPAPWDARYRDAGIERVAPGAVLAPAADWWLVDGYDLGVGDAPTGARLARIDDHALSPAAPVDLLVDQNLGAMASTYDGRAADVRVGTRYALLRSELVAAAGPRRARDPRLAQRTLRVLVMMGGAPADHVRVFLDEVVVELARTDLRVKVLRGGDDPTEAYATADLALAPAGSTSWELALFAVPAVLLSVADNQVPLGIAMSEAGAASFVGPIEGLDPVRLAETVRVLAADVERRAALAAQARRLVDGWGAPRVATRLRADLLALRPVGPDDARTVHQLNDDPQARAVSRSTAPIPWEDHERWFAARLVDPSSHLYLAHDAAGDLVGLVRFAVDARVAEVSVVVDASRRGQGWGGPLIDAGVRRLHEDLAAAGTPEAVVRVDAMVRADHRASATAFLDADFDPAPTDQEGWLRYARSHAGGSHG
ncbi:MAG: bifunctional UDP-2,4-diacetamido-2,4,6-trideoxy-beta-L-altropyranose hydrolase/GNAT family N-acetyltransferase [Acidimicrobiales bacterium]